MAKPEKRKNEKAAQNNVGRVTFANKLRKAWSRSARIVFWMTHDGNSDKQMQEHETMDPTDKDKRGEC